MVFTGIMNYMPNNQGVLHFLDNILPLIQQKVPDAKIYIVGDKPSGAVLERASENIIITGWVDDVRSYITQAQVYVIPLLNGGGTRLKALEAAAMKKPIVSTTIGCEGISLENKKSVLFADTPEEFAGAVIKLFNDPLYRDQLAENANKVISEFYGWSSIGKELNDLFESVLQLQQ